jgi:hypothetical protein
MSVGSASDIIDLLTGDGLQTWSKLEFDGSERWIALTGSYANYTYCVAITGKTLGHQTSICSHHQNVNQAFSANIGKPGMYCDHPSNTNVYFVSEKPTLDDFKSWLTKQKAVGTPVTLWYQLEQPTTYQVTPVSDLRSYDGTTNHSVLRRVWETFAGCRSNSSSGIGCYDSSRRPTETD